MLRQLLIAPSTQVLYSCIVMSLLVSACTKTKPSSSDWQRLNLKSKVMQLQEWSYNSYQAFTKKQHKSQQTNFFSEKGMLTKTVFYENSNRLIWTYYTYKPDSVWVRKTLQVNGGMEQNQNYWLYELNENGQQEVLTSLLLDSSIFHKITLQFNEKQLPVKMVYTEKRNPTSVPCEIHKEYNEQGQVIKELIYVYDKANQQCHPTPSQSTYTYNEQGDILRENITYYNGSQNSYSYQYQYDSLGNWINCLHYEGDQVIEVTRREFTYF